MDWQYTPYIFPVLIGALISTLLTAYAWQRRRASAARPFAFLMLAVTGWSLGYAVELGGQNLATLLFGNRLAYTGVTAVPFFWLWFALQYTERQQWLNRRNLMFLSVIPIITLLLLWTNNLHGLIWQNATMIRYGDIWLLTIATRGPWFWFHFVFAYGMLLAGSASLLLSLYQRAIFVNREQSISLLVGMLIPWAGNALYILGYSLLDLTPFGFAIGGLLIAWGIFRSRLFEVMPAAHKAVWQQMQDGMLLLDAQNHIVEINPAAQAILGRTPTETLGKPLHTLLPNGIEALLPHLYTREVQTAVELVVNQQKRCFELQVSPFYNRFSQITGRLVVLRDITERVHAEEAVRTQKQLFESLVTLAPAITNKDALCAGLQHTLQALVNLTDAYYGAIYLLDTEIAGVSFIGVANGAAWYKGEMGTQTAVFHKPLADLALRQQQVVYIADTAADDQWQNLPTHMRAIRSALAVPLIPETTQTIGVLTLYHIKPTSFTSDHIDLIRIAADQMALVLHSALLSYQQQRVADRQIVTYKLLRAMGESLEPAQVAYIAVATVADLTGWPSVAISVPDAGGQRFKIQAAVGVLRMDQGVNGRAYRTGKTQISPDPALDVTWLIEYTALAVPLRRGRQRLGLFNIEIDRPNGFSEDDILLAESLGEAIVLALDNARLYTEMQQRLHEQMVLQRAGSLLASTLDLPTLLSTLAEQMGQLVGATSVYICRYDAPLGTGTVVAEYFSEQARPQERVSNLNLTYSIADILSGTAALLEAGQPKTLFITELNHSQSTYAYRRNLQAQSILLIPLQVSGHTIAYAELWESRQRREFTAAEISLCQAIAQQAAIAMEQARLFQAITQEQSRLRALIEADRDGIMMIGIDGRILVVNHPTLTFLQLPGLPADWIDRPFNEALLRLRRHAPEVVRCTIAELRRVRVGGEPAAEGEFEIGGHAINWRSLPVLEQHKPLPLGRLVVLRDVTEERLLERMRDDLIHTMVHDLRGPLTSISVSLHLLDTLASGLEGERSRSILLRAYKSMETVLDLVNAILDISRLESGHMTLNWGTFSLSQLMSGLLEWQLPLMDNKNLKLELHIATDLPDVWGDIDLLSRVLQNLVGNAIKFTSEGGVIGITAAIAAMDNAHIQLTVSDTGHGIPPEISDRLFQKFTKGGQEGSGSGLGLYFCKMVIEAHGERIWIGKTAATGTAVHFTLPIANNQQAP